MTTLFAVAMLPYGLIGFFRFLGLIAGIGLIIFWWTRVKSTVALFHDKAKIRATLFFFLPGFILVVLGVYFRFVWRPSFDDYSYGSGDYSYDSTPIVPTMAHLYMANFSDEMGRIQVGSFVDSLGPKESRLIEVKSNKDQDTLKAWLGDSLVIDTIISGGNWIGNFSDDVTVSAEEVVYTEYSSNTGPDPGYELLSKPGIEQFSAQDYITVYGFDSEAPQTISVTQGSGDVRRWDVSTMTDEQMMSKLLDALKSSGADLGEDE